MNYRQEILKMIARIPARVTQGSYHTALNWKNAAQKAGEVVKKTRASEAELARVYSDLKQYE